MSCALDTNVLLDLVAGNTATATAAAAALESESRRGGLSICAPVYCECLAHPAWRESDLEELLRETRIGVTWDLSKDVWVAAGRAFARYAARRRRERSGEPRRLLVDFVIGAHAAEVGSLLTRDPFFRTYFPDMRIVRPSPAGPAP